MKLKDKVVIITGASSGIGEAVAKLFASQGAKVVAGARRLEKLQGLKDYVEEMAYQGEILPVQVDVAKDEDLKRLVDTALENYHTVDVLVNNAGILDEYKSLENVEDDLWMKLFDVNVHSIMKLSRLVIPIMKEKKSGSIINTASVGGIRGMRGGLGYVTSKHAVVGMTKNIAYTYADQGIRCNAVAPGSIATEIGKKVSNPDMTTLNKLMDGFKIFPQLGQPEDIAKTYLYLASEDSIFTNGHILVVDGGWTAY